MRGFGLDVDDLGLEMGRAGQTQSLVCLTFIVRKPGPLHWYAEVAVDRRKNERRKKGEKKEKEDGRIK